jgi:hypothetical protein
MGTWVRTFYPSFSKSTDVILLVLKSCASVYGVDPAQLRPGDVLLESYGRFEGLVLDDSLPTVVQSLQGSLKKARGLHWEPNTKIVTVDDLVRDVIGSCDQEENSVYTARP